MWTIIIIIAVVSILYFGNNNLNKIEEKINLSKGGFRKSFPTFTNHLENFYDMGLMSDTGRKFYYSKEIIDINGNVGLLSIGVKLDMRGVPTIFSKFKNGPKSEFLGIDVCGVDFNSPKTIDECINISIDKIKSQGIIDNNFSLRTQNN